MINIINKIISKLRKKGPAPRKPMAVVLTHQRPDADAFGSAIGLAITLNGVAWFAEADWANAPATIKALADKYLNRGIAGPYQYTNIQIGGDAPAGVAVYVTDCGDPSRVSAPANLARIGTAVVASYDHHCNAPIGDGPQYGQPTMASACAVVAKIHAAEKPLYKSARAFLWAGHIGDTARFTVGDIAEGIREAALIDPAPEDAALINAAYGQISQGRAHLLGRFWSSLYICQRLGLAMTRLSQEDFRICAASKADYAGMPGLLLDVDGVSLGVALCEDQSQPGVWRIAFRSRGTGLAQELARMADGDGHPDAAGGVVPEGEDPCAWVERLVCRALRK